MANQIDDEQIKYIEVESMDDLLSKIEDIKEKITDQEYMDLMTHLSNVNKDVAILTDTINVMANNSLNTTVELKVFKGKGNGLYDQHANHRICFQPDQERMAFELYVDGEYHLQVPED